jgi:hypothetical protein
VVIFGILAPNLRGIWSAVYKECWVSLIMVQLSALDVLWNGTKVGRVWL